ncbi:MAG: hypothetical protein GY759_03990, partial [Chloroflexi bacterium]|nr:hypothetical protein [Chloroflexota bacterium]
MTESELAALEETNPEEFKNLSNLAKEGLIIIDPEPIEPTAGMSPNADAEFVQAVENDAEIDGIVVSEAAEASSASGFKAIRGTLVLQALLAGTMIAMVWTKYASQAKSLQGIQKDIALSQAIAATIMIGILAIISVVLAIFATTVVGTVIEVAILAILYLLVAIITGDWNPIKTYSYLTDWLSEWLLKLELLVEVGANSVKSGPMQLKMLTADPTQTRITGPMPGNRFQISLALSTTLSMNSNLPAGKFNMHARAGNANDVAASWGYARWEQRQERPSYLSDYAVSHLPRLFTKDNLDDGLANCDSKLRDDNSKGCYSTNDLYFNAAKAGRNSGIPYLTSMQTYLKYEKCWFNVIGYSCSTDMNYTDSTDDSSVQDQTLAYFYIDIIPDNLDTLFTWNVHNPISNTNYADFNVDQDNDDLSDTQESSLGTDKTKWDTDGDGLSDGWEHENGSTSPTLFDTDADGLSDGQEISLGTSPTTSDTDTDGLLDGEEVCYVNSSGNRVGGWKVHQLGDYWVCSNPKIADFDGDGLTDDLEKEAGLSPYAPDTAPELRVDPTPSIYHNGGIVTVLKAGDPLS